MTANWTFRDVEEASQIVQRMCPVILSTAPSIAAPAGPQLRQVVGEMAANASDYILDGTLSHRVVIALTLARMCAATMQTLAAVRKAALTEAPAGLLATATQYTFVSLSLVQEAIATTTMVFASRDDAIAAQAVMMAAFEDAEEAIPDALDQSVYIAMIGLHGSVARQFYEMELMLPRVISYQYQVTWPALKMSQRAYGDATHSDELWQENNVVHPAFMPRQGKMLAVT
jgi:prophage DNA circulation protein